MPVPGICRLCEQERQLEVSHILPRFVVKWQRDTAVSAIREVERPNVRTQDGTKLPFLCSDCEDRFESYETPFAASVFHRVHQPLEALPTQVSYGRFGLKFAVSVSWRLLRYWSENERFAAVVGGEKYALVQRALARWRQFLLDDAPHPAEFEQHVLPLNLVERPIAGQSPSFNRYAVRAVEHSFAHSSEIMFVYSKLGRLVVFGMLPPYPRVPGWRGTKLHVNKGVIVLRNAIIEIPEPIADFLNDRAEYAARSIVSISPRQKSKIDIALRDRLATNPTGELFEALIRDYEQFGDEAINRKFPDDGRNA